MVVFHAAPQWTILGTLGPTVAALVAHRVTAGKLALIWVGWHLPLFWYPGWSSASPCIYVLLIVGSTVLLTYGTNLARVGVITPIAMHAVFNTVGKFLNGLFKGTDGPRVDLPFELVMALSGLAVAGGLIVVTRGRLGYAQDPGLEAMARRVAVRRFAP